MTQMNICSLKDRIQPFAWESSIDRQQRDESGNYLQQEACDIITVDVRTGKLSEYFDKVSQR